MKAKRVALVLACAAAWALIAVSPSAVAKVGVGVNVGKIDVEQALYSGGIYALPSIGVVNTGDEPATYSMRAVSMTGQKERIPKPNWFAFDPKEFPVAPGAVQSVQVQLTLPVNAEPGKYFTLLMASPSKTATSPGANIAVGAGTKVSFTVEQTNIFRAIYYRIRDLMKMYSPWSWILLAIVVVAVIAIPLSRKFRFSLGVQRRTSSDTPEDARESIAEDTPQDTREDAPEE